MLRIALSLITALYLAACSRQHAPTQLTSTTPAGKARCLLCGVMEESIEQSPEPEVEGPEEESSEVDSAASVIDDSFDIDLVFIDPLTVEQKVWIRDVANRWERYFYDAPDYEFTSGKTLDLVGSTISIPAGERIDDIRIYIGQLKPGYSNHPGWDQEAGGIASVVHFRSDGVLPVVAIIRINEREIERSLAETFSRYSPEDQHKLRENTYWKKKFHHEMGHAFGIGPSPAWIDNVVLSGRDPFFIGTNALREYNQLHPNPHKAGIPLHYTYFGEEVASHILGGIGSREFMSEDGSLGWTLFQMYWNFANDGTNISRVVLGMFEDIGWSVNYELAPDRLIDDEFLGNYWVQSGAFSWLDFYIDFQDD